MHGLQSTRTAGCLMMARTCSALAKAQTICWQVEGLRSMPGWCMQAALPRGALLLEKSRAAISLMVPPPCR